MRPPIQKEIRIRFELGELYSAMGFEGMPDVAAAIAHQLHFGFVSLVAWHEFAPIVIQSQFLHQEIVGKRPVVGQLGSFHDPSAQSFGDHVSRWYA